MKFDFYKNLGRGLTISILALSSLSAVYHVDAIAAGGNSGGNGGGGNSGGGNSGGSDNGAKNSDGRGGRGGKAGNDSGIKKLHPTLTESYQNWLNELLKE